jgi:uncharacterized membrane protein
MRRLGSWYPLLVVIASVAMSAAAYPRLPERVPVHWGVSGAPDRWGHRAEAAVFLPMVIAAMWGLLRVLPKLDPRASNFAKMRGTYDFSVNAILTMILVVHALALAAGLGYVVSIVPISLALVGALFVALGNVLPRARPNWWFGVRTPWTLSNDRVWARTHRVGGYVMTAAGIVILAAAALPGTWPYAAFVVATAAAVIAPVVY